MSGGRKCTAHRRDGEPCRRWALTGAAVCPAHGGRAPQVAAAARRRVAAAHAEQEIAKIIHDPAARPVTDPITALARLAGQLEVAAGALGERVNGLTTIGTRSLAGVETVRAEVDLWTRLLGLLHGALASLARVGLAERVIEMEESAAARLAQEHQWIMDRLIVAGLVASDRRGDLHGVLAEALGALVEGRPLPSVQRVIEA